MFKSTSVLTKSLFALIMTGALAAFTVQPAAAQTAKKLNCKGCVKSKQVKNNGIKSKDIKDGEVGNADLADDAVTNGKIAADAVGKENMTAPALAGGREPIEECGTIAQPGSYVLLNDLPGPSGLNADHGCLVIEADNVTLDLGGFSIVGDGVSALGPGRSSPSDGVFMNGRSNVTIRNGTIRNFGDEGIDEADHSVGRDHRVSNIQAIGNGVTGIRLSGSNHHVANCLSNDNGDRAMIFGYGIAVGDNATVTGNTANGNGDRGIGAGSGSSVTGNRAIDNRVDGIAAGNDSAIAGNVATGHGDNDIEAGNNSAITGNVTTGTGGGNIICGMGCSLAGNIPPP